MINLFEKIRREITLSYLRKKRDKYRALVSKRYVDKRQKIEYMKTTLLYEEAILKISIDVQKQRHAGKS